MEGWRARSAAAGGEAVTVWNKTVPSEDGFYWFRGGVTGEIKPVWIWNGGTLIETMGVPEGSTTEQAALWYDAWWGPRIEPPPWPTIRSEPDTAGTQG